MSGPAITAKLGLDTSDFQKGLSMAQNSLKGFGHGLAGALTIGAVAQFTQEILDFAGGLQDASDKLGVSVEALQELDYAFGQSGASATDVDKAITKLQQTAVDATNGNRKLLDTYERLGVSFSDLRDLTPDEILMKIASSAGEAQDPSQRLSDILDVLGKSGGRLAAGLNGGVDALKELRKEASKLTQDEIKALDDAGDSVARFWNGLKVFSAKGLNRVIENMSSNANFGSMSASGAFNISQPKPAAPAPSEKAPEVKAAEQAAEIKRGVTEDERRAQSEQAQRAAQLYFAEEARKRKLQIDEESAQDKRQADEEKFQAEMAKWVEEEYGRITEEQVKKKAEREKEAADKAKEDEIENAFQKEMNRQDRRDQFIEDKLDPNGARERKRDQRKREHLGRRFDREEALAARGGRAKADAPDAKDPSAEFLSKIYEIMKGGLKTGR